jgi:tetratricopeptide (TPR) repeat protein
MPNLTLTMIVRDEEHLLPGCLASVCGVVDEIVVVDTGSRDGTRRVAEKAGARVHDFTWCDDFAAARNEALRHATGKWVLVLDADERLSARSGRTLRATLKGARFDCGMLRLHDAARIDASHDDVVSGRERQAEVQLVPRLLRRVDGLAFVDPIHENALPWMRRRGMKVAGVDADIIHLGATEDVVVGKGKVERNIRMLRGRLALDPFDVAASGYLAHDLIRAGDPQAALEVAARGWQAVLDGHESSSSIHRVATAYAYLLIGKGRHAEAREVATRAIAIEGPNPDFAFFVAYANESEVAATADPGRQRELLSLARDGYRECLGFGARVFAQAFVVGARTWYGATRLGTVEMLLGQAADAERAFDLALVSRPGYELALLGKAEAVLERGDAARALGLIEPLLGAAPDGWTLASSAALAVGRTQDARLFAVRALQVVAKGFVGSHRRSRLHGVASALGLGATPGGSSVTARVIGESA